MTDYYAAAFVARSDGTLHSVYDHTKNGMGGYAVYATREIAQEWCDSWNGTDTTFYFVVPAEVLFNVNITPTLTPKRSD